MNKRSEEIYDEATQNPDMPIAKLKEIIFAVMQHKNQEELSEMARMLRSQATSCEIFAEKGGFQESLMATIRELS